MRDATVRLLPGDAMLENGMAGGVEDGFNRLDELMASLQTVGAIN